jgi:fructuronate reductase
MCSMLSTGTAALGDAAIGAPPHRLSLSRLHELPQQVRRPTFDPAALQTGILHLGCGSFHRAHQALLTQLAIEAEHGVSRRTAGRALPSWGIAACSLRSPTTTRALARQDGLYTVLERGPEYTGAIVVGTLRRALYVPESVAWIDRAFRDPNVRIVSLTVTASGYCTDPAGRLDVQRADVQSDLQAPCPQTAIGLLVRGLRHRRDSGVAPPVLLSCDNLPGNGRVLRQACIDFAALHDDALAAWIAREVQFPSTMVDRIVPGASPEDRDDARAAHGLEDAAPVSAEPYHQWVVERFDGPRPRWDAAGAEYVSDVGPWEASKLRLLNGGHLALAWLGRLAGCATVADAMTVPGLSAFVPRFMLDEQKPTLPPSNHDIDLYARQLLARWRSRSISHQLDRITRDGSAKLPTRVLASLLENRRARRPVPCTVLAVAAWMRCLAGRDDAGRKLSFDDELGARLRARITDVADDPAALVDRLLACSDVFDDALTRDADLRLALKEAVVLLHQRGARAALPLWAGGSTR